MSGFEAPDAAPRAPLAAPAHPFSYTREKTFDNLLGLLAGEPTVWAECLFVDPIADIAVLGAPDDQALPKQAEAYEGLVASTTPLTIVPTDSPMTRAPPVPGDYRPAALDLVRHVLERHLYLTVHQLVAVTLWIAHTFIFDKISWSRRGLRWCRRSGAVARLRCSTLLRPWLSGRAKRTTLPPQSCFG